MKSNRKFRENRPGQQSIDYDTITIQNVWDAAKAVLREKFVAIQVFLQKKKGKKNFKQPNLPLKRIRGRINKT